VPDLDPHTVTGVPEFHVMDALYEGLVAQDAESREIMPALAESWEISEDRMTYVFRLRQGLEWSDGMALTAEDMVRSCERAMNPLLAADYAYLIEILENGRAYTSGELEDFAQVGVKALDTRTVEFRLEHPVPYFLSLMTYPCWRVLPMRVVEAHDGLRRRGGQWTRAGNLVSSGPFVMTRWEQNRVLVVERNPRYWDAANVGLNAIHFLPVESSDTEERMFRSGQLHITNTVPLTKLDSYRAMSNTPLRIEPQLGTYFYRFNVTRPPFDNVHARRALSLAIDRKAIVELITGSGESPAGSFAPPGAGGFVPSTTMGYDPEAARRELAAAGYPSGEGFPAVELLYNTLESHRTIAEAIQQMWKTTLGIDVQLYNQEWKVYLDTLDTIDYNISRGGWVAVVDDANQFVEIFTPGNPNNHTGWASEEYAQLHDASMREGDPAKRMALLQELDAMLVEQAIVAPIYHYARKSLVDLRVQGWNPGPLDKRNYKQVRLVAKE
jgi:oligopeptide transport system substrate-binding protein